jgi:hypothetical protein
MRFPSTDELSSFLEALSSMVDGIKNTETMVCLEVGYGKMYAGLTGT